jgi:serine protease Do
MAFQSSNRRLRTIALAAAIMAAVGAAGSHVLTSHAVAAAASVSEQKTNREGLPSFTTLVEKVAPAVVSIRVTREEATPSVAPNMPQDRDGQDFFHRFPGPNLEPFAPPEPTQGMGSGFIVSQDGYILTNAHVVAGAAEVTVLLDDKRELNAKVIGIDRKTDVALIKVDAKNLPAVKIGDPQATRVGEWVAAIGAPFGFDHSVTAGIVSAKSRSLQDGYVPFIQTDVALNPGNSGGPLLNLDGEVIGINSQIYSRTGGYMGLSFAIPIDVAVKVKDQLQQHGKVIRARIGVVIQDLSKDLAESFSLAKASGALVSSMDTNGPAAAAGVQPGDVIVKINGKEVKNSAEASRSIADLKPGESVKLNLWRNGADKEITVRLGELSGDAVADNSSENPAHPKLGVAVRALSPEEKKQLGTAGGVVVEQVSGPAARAGIRPGDVILSFNNKPVSDAQELKRLVNGAGKRAALLVERDGARIFVPVAIG